MPSDPVKQHYDTLLGDHYRWSVAGDADPFERGARWLSRHGLLPGATADAGAPVDAARADGAPPRRYLDLGAGFGAHAVPLARAGASVTAVDFHAGLLASLRAAAPSVDVHEADLVAFLEASPASWDAILCLGDTLTHLASAADVQRLLAAASSHLRPDGVLAVSYRDYSGPPRTGLDRFIPVRADATRSLVCCLDTLDATRLSVTDILTLATADGLVTRLSSYPKLRLAPATIAAQATSAGLALSSTATEHGLITQIYRLAPAP